MITSPSNPSPKSCGSAKTKDCFKVCKDKKIQTHANIIYHQFNAESYSENNILTYFSMIIFAIAINRCGRNKCHDYPSENSERQRQF